MAQTPVPIARKPEESDSSITSRIIRAAVGAQARDYGWLVTFFRRCRQRRGDASEINIPPET